ncbi:M20/M25/M40 family metallo-hydrolase [Mycobacteroides chelonae]|nr:M20/M25/M40 family metallo-hydrolase [Mycobacteroides chelonae]
MIFNGHLDVVPANDSDEWTHDPFSGFHDETHVWGRGSVDMKSGLVAQAFATKALRESGVQLRGDLILQGVVGEENFEHHLGTSAVLARGYTADGAIIAEPTGARRPLTVMPATPGVLVMRITVSGRSGHASARSLMRAQAATAPDAEPVAVSAIDAALSIHAALCRLEVQWEQTRTDPLFERGQFTIGLDVIDGVPAAAAMSPSSQTKPCWTMRSSTRPRPAWPRFRPRFSRRWPPSSRQIPGCGASLRALNGRCTIRAGERTCVTRSAKP